MHKPKCFSDGYKVMDIHAHTIHLLIEIKEEELPTSLN